ncbi:S-adenosylmethionine transporter [Savitreella phatthalungensis]
METFQPLISGAFAGLAVDLSLFPLDTIKTRLQASGGFARNGGFKGIYAGMGSIAAGSAPGAAIFFLSYETIRRQLNADGQVQHPTLLAVTSSSIAESLACIVRVPTEVVKQRTQASVSGTHSSFGTLRAILASDGLHGLYRGFLATLAREIPFVCIQFPLWEYFKVLAVRERLGSTPHELAVGDARSQDSPQYRANAGEAAICGAAAGSIAAALTTPLDVIKTRMMLSSGERRSWLLTASTIAKQEGIKSFFRGIVPRVFWISIGGFIFLGGYSFASDTLSSLQ